jgi:hypothetical protein
MADMADWFKVTIAFGECGVGDKGQTLIDSFGRLLIESGGRYDAGMYSQRSEDFEKMFYYFSPGAMEIAGTIVNAFGGVPCSAPSRGTANLCAGNARAMDLLPVQIEAEPEVRVNAGVEGKHTCKCGLVWMLIQRKVPPRDKDDISCTCGRTLVSWNGGCVWTAKLIE